MSANETLTIKALEGLEPKDAAALFVARNAEGLKAEEEQLLAAWLERSKDNRREYETADKLWRTFVNIRGDEIQAAMRARAAEERKKRGARRWLVGSIIVAVLLAVAAVVVFTPALNPWTTVTTKASPLAVTVIPYTTLRGEIKEEDLPDGSHVSIDADSIVIGRFGPAGRQMQVQRGRALFAVVADRTKPFVVIAGERSIVAVGTRFDVNMLNDGIIVTLLEGHVVVEAKARGVAPVVLEAGQQFVERAGQSSVVTLGDTAANTVAWRAGFLYFKDQPLSDVLQMVNRYTKEQFVIGEPELASLPITGQFHTGDAEGFSKSLAESHQIASSRSEKKIELKRATVPASESPP
jgi:transmembrane sensor